jgi:uncharacterized protein YdaU (DUF1376 family)
MKLDWMPLDIPAYVADTGHLSTLEHGIYFLLIMHYWRTGGLPDDEGQLARIARVTATEFRAARPVIEPLFKLGGWKHKRIEHELEKARKISASNTDKAREAANARWSKDRNRDAPSISQAMLQNAPSPLPSPVKKESSSCDVKREARSPPRNGITSQKHGRIYVVKGTPEWPPYAEDYRAATGKEPNVNEHGGRWFKILGEAAE